MLIKKEKQPAIWIYEDVFDSKNFIELVEAESEKDWPYLSWSSSTTNGSEQGVISDYRTSYEMGVTQLLDDKINNDLVEVADLFKSIFKSIDECIWDYRNCYDLPLSAHEGFGLLKYTASAEYHRHSDHGPNNSRVLSMVASMGSDCTGGELEFPYFDLSIKLQKNSLILFPSNFPYTHIAHPVTSGVKYSLVTWFR